MLNKNFKKIGSLTALIAFFLIAQPALAQEASGSKQSNDSPTANAGTPGIDNDSARESTSDSDKDAKKDEESEDRQSSAEEPSGNTLSAEALAALQNMGGSGAKKKDNSELRAMARGRTSADANEQSLDIGDVQTTDQKSSDTRADLGEYSEYEVFESAIVARSQQVESCFAEHLDSKASGELVVRFRIAGSGEVKGAGVINAESLNDKVTRCIVKTVKGWRFPAPRSGQASTYSHPFTFGSK